MTRRSSRETDDRTFPIQIRVRLPSTSLGNILTEMLLWLSAEVGPGEYAQHPGQTQGGSAVSIYFRHPENLVRLLAAFPQLELADDTNQRMLRSPQRLKGKQE
jgi:hypothetical protein